MLYLPKTAISYEIINLLNYIILFKFLQRKGIIIYFLTITNFNFTKYFLILKIKWKN